MTLYNTINSVTIMSLKDHLSSLRSMTDCAVKFAVHKTQSTHKNHLCTHKYKFTPGWREANTV